MVIVSGPCEVGPSHWKRREGRKTMDIVVRRRGR